MFVKNWLNVSSLQQRSLDFDTTFKIEKREETPHNYAFIEQIYHILIQTSNLLTAIYNAFLQACEQISLTLPPRSVTFGFLNPDYYLLLCVHCGRGNRPSVLV